MIKLEHVVLPSPEQMEFIIEGMRNPMNSWDKSDSGKPFCSENPQKDSCAMCPARIDTFLGGIYQCSDEPDYEYYIGKNNLSLMKKLSAAGTDHRKFMRMMPVFVRITAPLYWWKEFDTYKVGTVANSCSTMHKITEKEFTLEDFSTEHLGADAIDILIQTKDILNSFRDYYINYESYDDLPDKKDIWWQLIQLLPSSYNQTRNVMLNYEVLANIYPSRKNHKLDEWQEFCKWIEKLLYSELITGVKED